MPDLAAMTTKDGRFGYEAAGKPGAPPLVFLHGIGGAARGWRGQLKAFGDRYHAMAWDMPGYGGSAPLKSVSIASLADALKDFLQQIGATKPCLVGHSIGGMIVQQLLVTDPRHRGQPWFSPRPARRSAAPTATGRRSFIEARLGPLDRGETMASLAPIAGQGADRRRSRSRGRRTGARLHGRGARGGLSGGDAGAARLRSARRAEKHRGADAGAFRHQGQQCSGSDDGQDGDLHPAPRAMSNSTASAISPIWNAPPPSTPRSMVS